MFTVCLCFKYFESSLKGQRAQPSKISCLFLLREVAVYLNIAAHIALPVPDHLAVLPQTACPARASLAMASVCLLAPTILFWDLLACSMCPTVLVVH